MQMTILNSNSRKGSPNKIKIHYGMVDYYNFYIECFKNKNIDNENNPFIIDKKLYNSIIEEYHNLIIKFIIEEGYEFKIPYELGALALRKFKPKLQINSKGKLINRLPVDIKSTMDLWKKDNKAKENKVLVRFTNKHSDGYVFTIHYFKKYKARFKNKTLYQFETVRAVKNKVKIAASSGSLDAYLLY